MTNENFAPKRSLRTQAITVAVATGVAQVIVAGLYIVAAKSSNVEDFGSVVAAVAAGIASVGLLDFGTNSFWVREISAGRMSAAEHSRRATWKVLFILAVGLGWAVVISVLVPGSPFWISGFVAFAQAFSLTVQSGLRARGRAELVGAAVIVDKVTAAVVFLAFLWAGTGILVAFVTGLIVGPLVSGVVSNWVLLADRRIRFDLAGPVNPWRGARNFGVANIAETARTYDVTLTALFGGAAAAGTYGAVNRWTQATELLTSAFSSASAPYMAHAPSARAAIRHLRSAAWLPLLAILVSCVTIVLAPWAVDLLLGDQYAGSANVLRILAAGTIVSNLNQPLFVFLMARGKDRSGARLLTTGVAVMLCLVVVLTPRLGAIGAAVAYAVGQLVLFVLLATAALRLVVSDEADEGVPSVR